MPYSRTKKGGRRSYRKRKATKARRSFKKYGRRRTGVKKAMSLRPKWLNPLSQRQFTRFTYADSSFSRTLNVGNGYSSYYVFRGNSIYDPDYTGVGVQPYGLDQHVGQYLYAYYRAPASSIKIYFRAEETYASIRRLHAFIVPLRIPNPVMTDISDVRMLSFHVGTTYDGATETTRGAVMKHYISTRKIFNEGSTNDFGFTGSYNSNPSGQWYWIVHFYTDVYDDEEVDIYFDVKIKYYTVLSRADVPNES